MPAVHTREHHQVRPGNRQQASLHACGPGDRKHSSAASAYMESAHVRLCDGVYLDAQRLPFAVDRPACACCISKEFSTVQRGRVLLPSPAAGAHKSNFGGSAGTSVTTALTAAASNVAVAMVMECYWSAKQEKDLGDAPTSGARCICGRFFVLWPHRRRDHCPAPRGPFTEPFRPSCTCPCATGCGLHHVDAKHFEQGGQLFCAGSIRQNTSRCMQSRLQICVCKQTQI